MNSTPLAFTVLTRFDLAAVDVDFQHQSLVLFVLQPKFEAAISEIEIVRNDICFAINNLKTWMLPEYVGTNLVRLSSET